jgi:SAM-dependent methyltransferase
MEKPMNVFSPPPPSQQRNRAETELLGGILKYSSGVMRPVARDNFRSAPEGQALEKEFQSPDSEAKMPELVKRAVDLAQSDKFYRLERFCQRLVAEEVMNKNILHAEEKRAEIEARAALPVQGSGGTLELDPDLKMPAYFEGVEWHLQPGGWDGYDLYGKSANMAFMNIYKYAGFAAVPFNTNMSTQRADVIRSLPKKHYDRILEIGCGPANTLAVINQIFPDAELTGCDLSESLLVSGFRRAQTTGLKVHLKQRDARATGEPDNHFDAVVSYAVHHEAPVSVNVEMFAEILRVLKPGGDLVISDPPPFRAVEPFHAAVLDWDTVHREEPYFSEASLANWDKELTKLGFVNVKSFALGEDAYPWVTLASKPLA